MRRLCLITALCALTVLSAAAAPAPAGAAAVGEQVERRAPDRFPESIGGCGREQRCVRGRTIPRRWTLLSRTVALRARERRTPVGFACPRGSRFRTFGHLERGDVLLQIPDSQLPYTGRSRIRVFGDRALTPLRQVARGTLYAVCVPR